MQRQVKLLGGQKSAAGAADLHGLAPFSVHHAAAELLHDLTQRGRFLGDVHMTGRLMSPLSIKILAIRSTHFFLRLRIIHNNITLYHYTEKM